jgi:hypothetical protein
MECEYDNFHRQQTQADSHIARVTTHNRLEGRGS